MTEGQVLAGRYELGAVLGRGGMAEVRAGWDRRLGRAVAVKTLLPELAEQPAIRRRFEGEARAAARLAHPNAVAVFDVGDERGVPFIVMEEVIGPTLEQEMATGPLDAERVRRLGQEVLAALGAAHAAGLVHRDVKPGNILMAADGSAKVADFGIAKAVADDEGTATRMDLTTTGQLLGTVAYMAPEQLAGRPATVQSDLYSVGVVLYEALTGARPFAAPTPIAMVRAIDQATPVPLAECRPELDGSLAEVVERAMAKEPDQRFATADEMAAALRSRAGPAEGASAAQTVLVGPATEIFDTPPTAGPSRRAVPADSPLRPGASASGGRRSRRRALALLAVAGLAVTGLVGALVATTGGNDHSTAPLGETPTTAAPPANGPGLPPALDDALRRLETAVR